MAFALSFIDHNYNLNKKKKHFLNEVEEDNLRLIHFVP